MEFWLFSNRIEPLDWSTKSSVRSLFDIILFIFWFLRIGSLFSGSGGMGDFWFSERFWLEIFPFACWGSEILSSSVYLQICSIKSNFSDLFEISRFTLIKINILWRFFLPARSSIRFFSHQFSKKKAFFFKSKIKSDLKNFYFFSGDFFYLEFCAWKLNKSVVLRNFPFSINFLAPNWSDFRFEGEKRDIKCFSSMILIKLIFKMEIKNRFFNLLIMPKRLWPFFPKSHFEPWEAAR